MRWWQRIAAIGLSVGCSALAQVTWAQTEGDATPPRPLAEAPLLADGTRYTDAPRYADAPSEMTPLPETLEELHAHFLQWSREMKEEEAREAQAKAAAAAAAGQPLGESQWISADAPPASIPPPPTATYPSVTINGVFQADAVFAHQDEVSRQMTGIRLRDGADFRRARLSAKGSVSETVNYFLQMDFGFFGRPTFTDVWVEQTGLPILGNVRIGQWKQPFSLEVVSSFRYTTFMERSVLFQPFTPFRHLGAGFYDNSDDLRNTWAASVFRTGQDHFGGSISAAGGWGSAERATWLPYWDDASDGRSYLHLGLGHYFSIPPDHLVNFRTIPEMYVGENAPGVVGTSGQPAPGAFNGTPFFVRSGVLNVNCFNVIGTEFLGVYGPLSLQSEVMVNMADQRNGQTATFAGGYAQVGYFLTGEHRPYDRKAGAIDRVKPIENFFRVPTDEGIAHGSGAWEVAFRVS